ncbi:competence protein CoiA family protein [Streptococcus infantis]|uniref:competence protein CoiA n=1 Tax=Streptococcus infantis TaxID=68892 RepID=UPI0039C11A26
MFLARDKNGNLISTLGDEVKKQTYYCPACGARVRLRKGKNVRTHFAHESLKKCDFFHENEGPEHLENKEQLFYWAKKNDEVEMEYPIPELKQIADIFVNKQLALEVQCSPISCDLLRERSNGYRSLGIQVLWLLGEKLWIKERLTQLQRDFLYFSNNMGFHIWELDHKRRVLRLKYLLHQDLKGKLHYQVKEFSYGKGNLLEILRTPYQQRNLISFSVEQDRDICYYIQKQLYYQNPYWMKQQAQAYLRGENLLNLKTQDWYPQVRPIEYGHFCQISQNLYDYYRNFQAYYELNSQNQQQKLYPPAFYQHYFSKNMVK